MNMGELSSSDYECLKKSLNEDTKRVITIRKSKKNRQHNGQKKKNRQHNGQKKKDKRANDYLQIIHIKLKIE